MDYKICDNFWFVVSELVVESCEQGSDLSKTTGESAVFQLFQVFLHNVVDNVIKNIQYTVLSLSSV